MDGSPLEGGRARNCTYGVCRASKTFIKLIREKNGVLVWQEKTEKCEKRLPIASRKAGEERGDRVFQEPKNSPWGKIQDCETLCPGIFLVTTAGHGGVMVAKECVGAFLPAARKCGFESKSYYCFEEDTQEMVALRELLDKGLWKIPDRITNKEGFEKAINESIQKYNPNYWQARQCNLEKMQAV